MKFKTVLSLVILFTYLAFNAIPVAAFGGEEAKTEKKSKVMVVWTSGDPEVAKNMVFMYVYNAKKRGWMDEVELLIWGPSAKLITEDKELQEYLKKIKEVGVVLTACKACADNYKVGEKLTKLGVEVKYMGVALSDAIKCKGTNVITFQIFYLPSYSVGLLTGVAVDSYSGFYFNLLQILQ